MSGWLRRRLRLRRCRRLCGVGLNSDRCAFGYRIRRIDDYGVGGLKSGKDFEAGAQVAADRNGLQMSFIMGVDDNYLRAGGPEDQRVRGDDQRPLRPRGDQSMGRQESSSTQEREAKREHDWEALDKLNLRK